MEETGHSSLNNGRATHIIGRLGSLVRVTDLDCVVHLLHLVW